MGEFREGWAACCQKMEEALAELERVAEAFPEDQPAGARTMRNLFSSAVKELKQRGQVVEHG